jgi:hypothetical protein
MPMLKLRLRLAENMPYPSPHWWQQEMFDASCCLDTFYFRRTDDNKTATSLLSQQHGRSGDIRKSNSISATHKASRTPMPPS